jgi:hypothetical protein
MGAVQLVDTLALDELDGEVTVVDAGRGEGRERGSAQLVRDFDEVDLDQGL